MLFPRTCRPKKLFGVSALGKSKKKKKPKSKFLLRWSDFNQVEGEKQSDLEIYVEKDGKILKIGKDVQLTIHGDRIQLDVINPKREKSGVYKVVLKNAQGQDEKLINVNIMDIPTPPTAVFVDTVFQDNCVVHWSPPKDNGGTEIKKYIVEVGCQF